MVGDDPWIMESPMESHSPRPPEWGLVGDPTAWLPAAPREERSAEMGKIKRGGCPVAMDKEWMGR